MLAVISVINLSREGPLLLAVISVINISRE